VIVSAHISTYGERVVDVFYVKDVFGLKITQGQKLRRIQQRLASALGAEPASEPAGEALAEAGQYRQETAIGGG
jgi:[protein-PII] uridylyltransferase